MKLLKVIWFGAALLSVLSILGCGADPCPAQEQVNLSATQSGEGTDKSPKNVKMKISTPDGDMSMNMKISENNFSMSIVLPKNRRSNEDKRQ